MAGKKGGSKNRSGFYGLKAGQDFRRAKPATRTLQNTSTQRGVPLKTTGKTQGPMMKGRTLMAKTPAPKKTPRVGFPERMSSGAARTNSMAMLQLGGGKGMGHPNMGGKPSKTMHTSTSSHRGMGVPPSPMMATAKPVAIAKVATAKPAPKPKARPASSSSRQQR